MGLLNNVFKWLILDRMGQIEAFNSSPQQIQGKIWENLIAASRNTEWGTRYGYSDIKSYRDYTRRVPVQDYNSIKPYIDRMMHGEPDILWPGTVNWFAKSSGTT